jgi:hypothetical protein
MHKSPHEQQIEWNKIYFIMKLQIEWNKIYFIMKFVVMVSKSNTHLYENQQ